MTKHSSADQGDILLLLLRPVLQLFFLTGSLAIATVCRLVCPEADCVCSCKLHPKRMCIVKPHVEAACADPGISIFIIII